MWEGANGVPTTHCRPRPNLSQALCAEANGNALGLTTHGSAYNAVALAQRGAPSVHALLRLRLEDGGGGGAAQAAGRVERIDAHHLVEEAAGDTQHRGAAVLALGVQLEGLDGGVVVAHPRLAADVARLPVADVGVALVVEEEVAGLHHARRELVPVHGKKPTANKK